MPPPRASALGVPPPVRRAPGRPREQILNRDLIADAAFAQIRTSGLRGLTMRALARRLAVTPSALYNHVASRDAVLALLQERFAATLDTTGFGILPLRDALSKWAWSYLERLRERPELVPLIVAVPLAHTPYTTLMYQRVVTGFSAAGWPDESIIAAMSVLETYIFGAVADSESPDDVYRPKDPERSPLLARTTAAFAATVAERGRRPRDLLFEIGLEALLTGMHHRWGSSGRTRA
ncbi:TetR/AcrR family transcriptional regulator [Microbacterium capsulatum]|uniref:TetR/AcrR family transcriptional regulator n=1 Tax=Microbacterium capsulatum TaxID=3041921 RepID=A0ABU0XDC1_9MICO|nr:TetR/AcrR family transcriptional regulator [Microbacterium sp. ASV81]MDQ4213114.1 TetR/AcrR family transcriptional regulator [Microbacterium sp. ASV81]